MSSHSIQIVGIDIHEYYLQRARSNVQKLTKTSHGARQKLKCTKVEIFLTDSNEFIFPPMSDDETDASSPCTVLVIKEPIWMQHHFDMHNVLCNARGAISGDMLVVYFEAPRSVQQQWPKMKQRDNKLLEAISALHGEQLEKCNYWSLQFAAMHDVYIYRIPFSRDDGAEGASGDTAGTMTSRAPVPSMFEAAQQRRVLHRVPVSDHLKENFEEKEDK